MKSELADLPWLLASQEVTILPQATDVLDSRLLPDAGLDQQCGRECRQNQHPQTSVPILAFVTGVTRSVYQAAAPSVVFHVLFLL